MLQVADKKQFVGTSLTVGAVAWAVLVMSAPLAAGQLPGPIGLMYLAGSLVCHQQPERSFHLASAQLPVCARCLGLYLGAAVGLAVWTWHMRCRVPVWSRRVALVSLAVAALPTAISAGTAMVGVGDPPNVWRWAMALPLGVAGGLVAGAGVSDRLK